MEIGGLEDSPLHEETKAGESLSQSHHHHHVYSGRPGNEMMLIPSADILPILLLLSSSLHREHIANVHTTAQNSST